LFRIRLVADQSLPVLPGGRFTRCRSRLQLPQNPSKPLRVLDSSGQGPEVTFDLGQLPLDIEQPPLKQHVLLSGPIHDPQESETALHCQT
jgi:hypothetical protein